MDWTDFITLGVMIQTTTFVSIFYELMMVWEKGFRNIEETTYHASV